MLIPGRTWAIAPAEHGPKVNEIFDRCWQYDRNRGVIAVGWDLGRAPKDRDDLQALWESCACPIWTAAQRRMLERFWFEIQPGDWVVARAGRSLLVGVGTVEGKAFYDQAAGGATWGCSLRPVRWERVVSRADALPRERSFPRMTVCCLSEGSVADLNRRLREAGWDAGSA